MSEAGPDVGPTRLRTAAMVVAAAAVGVPVVLAGLVQAVLYQLNPRGEVLTGFGAYELEVGATLLIAVIAMAVVVAWVFARLAAVDRGALRYPLLVIQLQVGFAVALIALVLLTPGLL